ncbi:hypothetical protein ACFVW1_26435 [Streptomyces olivochromogenes]|uniref:hypothetical protein n=1 Tax=Streptomyces olivochromogenes TaxID=1963 RepID=UPI0036D995EC
MAEPAARRTRNLVHVDPTEVSLQSALDALSDPVRRSILRECAGEPDFSRACGTFDLPVSKATALVLTETASAYEQTGRAHPSE